MPSGYEKSPDYGGPEPTRKGIVVLIIVVAALSAGLAYLVVSWRDIPGNLFRIVRIFWSGFAA